MAMMISVVHLGLPISLAFRMILQALLYGYSQPNFYLQMALIMIILGIKWQEYLHL